MIFEQNDTYVEAERSGPYLELEFWSRGRHRGFVRLAADQVQAAMNEGREIRSGDGLRLIRTDAGDWLVEYVAQNNKSSIRLTEEEAHQAFFQSEAD